MIALQSFLTSTPHSFALFKKKNDHENISAELDDLLYRSYCKGLAEGANLADPSREMRGRLLSAALATPATATMSADASSLGPPEFELRVHNDDVHTYDHVEAALKAAPGLGWEHAEGGGRPVQRHQARGRNGGQGGAGVS